MSHESHLRGLDFGAQVKDPLATFRTGRRLIDIFGVLIKCAVME